MPLFGNKKKLHEALRRGATLDEMDDETKVKFRAAVAELRQSAAAVAAGGGSPDKPSDGTQRGAWLELMERYGGGSSAVSAEVAELREQLHASELREQQKDNELHASELREQQKDNDLLKKDNDLLKRDEEIAALRQQLALARP